MKTDNDTGQFEILIDQGAGPTDRDFLIMAVTGEDSALRRVSGLNTAMERDNPREYTSGRRYYYRLVEA